MATEKQTRAFRKIKRYRENILQFVNEEFSVTPDRWQEKALLAAANKQEKIFRMSLQACAGPGKLLHCETIVATPNGPKCHGKLKAGDVVFAEDGTRTNVVATIKWDNIQYYEIIFSDGTKCKAGAQHIWKVQSRHFSKFKDWNTAETQELFELEPTKIYKNKSPRGTDRKVRRFRIPIQGAVHFTENDQDIELPIDPYLLGLWLGDGGRNSSCITKDDECPFLYLKEIGYSVSKYKKHESSGQRYGITGLKDVLSELKVNHLYSSERYIPDLYKYASSNQRKELLRGLMDTDGRIKINGMMDFHSTSKQLIDDFVWLARSIGQYAHGEREVDTRKETSDCYSASIRTDFNPFRIKRKGDRWKMPPEHQMYRYIESIKKLDVGSGICIEIDHPSHCYLANDFIVTHNSTVLSWFGWWFLLTQGERGSHPKAAAISVTRDNLKDNLWSELSKWQQRSDILKGAFVWTQTRIFAKDFPQTWFMSARGFSKSSNTEEQGRVLSGIHSKYVLFLIDESGDIPPVIMKSVDQAFSTQDKVMGRVIQAGNPTSTTGMLYAAQSELADLWHVIRITGDPEDSDRSPRIDLKWAINQINKYGRDDPWVQAYILGRFPESGINTLLTADQVEDSFARQLHEVDYEYAQKRIGVDVARFGDDSTIIYPRQGLRAFNYAEMRGAVSPDIAARVALAKAKWGSEMEFVDGTGGYGAGVVDFLKQAGHSPLEIHFSSKAIDPRYYNKRSEMWFSMAEWVKRGGSIVQDSKLKKELTTPTYSFKNGKFIVEPKESIKDRLGFSPDIADALCLTFALPEMPGKNDPNMLLRMAAEEKRKADYDPLRDA